MSGHKLLIFTVLMLFGLSGFAQHGEEDHGESRSTEATHEEGEGGGDVSEVILEHILDSHDWHITDIPTGGDHMTPIVLHLPWLLYDSEDGLVFAANTEALVEKGYLPHHDTQHRMIYKLKPGVETEGLVDHHGHAHVHDWATFTEENTVDGVSVFDLSLTKTGLQMILVGLVLVLVMTAVARSYARREGQAPKGLQSFIEPIIIFVRDEVARPYLGVNAGRFMPYLLTLFFFIWFANLFGLMPFNSNIAGNISFTAALAVLTFILTQVNGSKDYWKHIFNTPGVPWWLKFGIPLMPLVEIIGLFTKPFALAVRLFANITAGHFMVLGLVSLIFIMGDGGSNLTAGIAIMPLSVLFTIVIFALEMIVAVIQPFIFTLLTAVFIGMAMETHDEHH